MHKFTRLSVMVFLVYVGTAHGHPAQVKEKNSRDATVRDQALVERGKYIVEGVAMCETLPYANATNMATPTGHVG